MSKGIIAVAVAGLFVLCVAPASAQTLGGVTFHGFVGQGYLKSTDNNWLSAPTSEGSFAFTEAALNFTVEPASKLRVGGQFYARDLGVQGNNKVVLDWAVGDYRFRDWLGIRAGKVKMPTGLYNIVIDNPVARPEIIMPSGLYPLSTRDLANTVQGFDLYGTIDLGGAGELDYETWVGTIDLDGSYLIQRFLVEAAYAGLPALGLEQPNVLVSEIKPNMKYIWGGALDWRVVPGLRFKFSGNTSESSVASAATYGGYTRQGPIPIPVSFITRSDASYKQDYTLFYSGEYRQGGLRLAAEYYMGKNVIEASATGLPVPVPVVTATEKPYSWYGQASYRFNETFEASGYYSYMNLDRDDKDGLRFLAQGQPAYRAWMKQWTFSGRADINSHWLVKAEASFINGTAGVALLDNLDGFTESWKFFALQMVVHF